MPSDFTDDAALIDALRAGDEAAFGWMLDQYHAPLLRTARMYVATDAHADEVVQETWLAVIKGIDRFERRSSVKTWIYRILMNIARTKGVRESRSVPFSSVPGALTEGADPTFSADRFRPPDDPEWPGHWASFPLDWEHQPEARLLAYRDPLARRRGPARTATGATRGADAPRRQRVDLGRGLSRTWSQRDEPTGTSPPRPRQSPDHTRVLFRNKRAVMTPPVDDFPCNHFVEVVTEYLEGAMEPRRGSSPRRAPRDL